MELKELGKTGVMLPEIGPGNLEIHRGSRTPTEGHRAGGLSYRHGGDV